MADGNQEGLGASGGELSSKEELFSGSLELPEGGERQNSELPEAKANQGNGTGTPAGQSGDSGSEDFNFADLEKRVPEELRAEIKKVQGYVTKKNQTYAEKLKALEANQITDELKQSYGTLYGWYDRIQKNPQQGLRELASSLGVSVKTLLESSEASQPMMEEITLDKLRAEPTIENFYKALTQVEERIRNKEVKPLQEEISKFRGSQERVEYEKCGADAIKRASNIPGFLTSEGKISKEGWLAIELTSKGLYGLHEDALNNAVKSVLANSLIEKNKELETSLTALRANIAGAGNPPERKTQKTTIAPSKPDRFWSDLRSEPLSSR